MSSRASESTPPVSAASAGLAEAACAEPARAECAPAEAACQQAAPLALTNPGTAEQRRLADANARVAEWRLWGPYLSERQWGVVREDYSPLGDPWKYFPHDHARARAYRWGEDGLLGVCDEQCRLCFAWAFWNGRDPILKERLFGLASDEGPHGEDVKEIYHYIESTPTHSVMMATYKYPHARFPYEKLAHLNRRRGREAAEYELVDTGALGDQEYFEIFVEYAKNTPHDLLAQLTVVNRGAKQAVLDVLPTLWFRNTWSWNAAPTPPAEKPLLGLQADGSVRADHPTLGPYVLFADVGPRRQPPRWLFTENETNFAWLYGGANASPHVKDAFHRRLTRRELDAVHPEEIGTKCAAWYRLHLEPGRGVRLRLRLCKENESPREPFGAPFAAVLESRQRESHYFHRQVLPAAANYHERDAAHQAYAGLLWSKQFYHYQVDDWLRGDSGQPSPPAARRRGRNAEWRRNLAFGEVAAAPDKWEHPWFSAWDAALSALPLARVDPEFAKRQVLLPLSDARQHGSGALPAHEWNFSDANPPVHAWVIWRLYEASGPPGARDREFLARAFPGLRRNFAWWMNRRDSQGRQVGGGGLLGLDNAGLFDAGRARDAGLSLETSDSVAWLAMFSGAMLQIALELAPGDSGARASAGWYLERFVDFCEMLNLGDLGDGTGDGIGEAGGWDESDGFYHDLLRVNGETGPLRVRSIWALAPLLAARALDARALAAWPEWPERLRELTRRRRFLAERMALAAPSADGERALLAVPSRPRFERVLARVLDESEFLSPFGVRSLSKHHAQAPCRFVRGGRSFEIRYESGVSTDPLAAANAPWRGPIWFSLNYLLIEALEQYHACWGDAFLVEFPTGSERRLTLKHVARELARRLTRLFVPNEHGWMPCNGPTVKALGAEIFPTFHQYFDADSGRGLGASHQTGCTALMALCAEKAAAPD